MIRTRERKKTPSLERRRRPNQAEQLIIPIENPFDFRLATQEKLFKSRMQSPVWRKRAEKWFENSTKLSPGSKVEEIGWHRVNWEKDQSARELLDKLYDFFLLEESWDLIVTVFPFFESTLSEIFAKLVVAEKDEPGDDALDFAHLYNRESGNHVVFIDTSLHDVGVGRYLDEKHAFRVLAIVHELLHAIVAEKYNFAVTTGAKNPYLTLATVLLEAVSKSLEVPIGKQILNNSPEEKSVTQYLDQYGYENWDWLSQINRLLWMSRKNGSVRDIENLQYREGVRIANTLRRRGWTTDDLPLLMDRIAGILQQFLGEDYQRHANRIVIDKSSNSHYQQIIRAITELKPQ